MNILWTICVVFYSLHLGVFCAPTTWVESLFGYIKNSETYQITFISNYGNSSGVSPIFDDLLAEIVENFATMQIKVGNPNSLDEDIVRHTVADMSTMFFILVYQSNVPLSPRSSELMINTAQNISAFKLRPQMLLVLSSQGLSDSLEGFLNYTWTKRMIDFTIAEFANAPKSDMRVQDEVVNPVIHQLNPFKNKYTKTNWTPNTKWFPEKVRNMWGHPFKVGVGDFKPFISGNFKEFEKPTKIWGANYELIKIIGREMNFTLDFVSYTPLIANCHDASHICLYNLMRSGKIDLSSYLSSHQTHGSEYRILRTAPIKMDKLCPVVPVLPRLTLPVSTNFFKAYALSFCIIMVFSIVSFALRFRSRLWRPFRVARVLFGVTGTEQPTIISERTLFAGLLLVSAIFSSNIYTAITGISLQPNSEMEFKTFKDLDESRLAPVISRLIINKTFGQGDEHLDNLRKKVIVCNVTEPCYRCPIRAAKDKNIMCLMIRDEANIVIQWFERNSKKPRIRIVEPCFWSDSTSFLLAAGSPYRSRINTIITRLYGSGLLRNLYASRIFNFFKEPVDNNDQGSPLDVKENMIALRNQLLAIVIVGYTISSIIFITEILVHRISKCIRP